MGNSPSSSASLIKRWKIVLAKYQKYSSTNTSRFLIRFSFADFIKLGFPNYDEILGLVSCGELSNIDHIFNILTRYRNPNKSDKLKNILVNNLDLFHQFMIKAASHNREYGWISDLFGAIRQENSVPPFEKKLLDLFFFVKKNITISSLINDQDQFDEISFESEIELNTFLLFFKKPEDQLILICKYLDLRDDDYSIPGDFLEGINSLFGERTRYPSNRLSVENREKIINRITNLDVRIKID